MNTIVMNTLNGAVTEYTGFDFQSVTPQHAGSAVALWTFGGDTDNGQLIAARVDTGARQWGDLHKKHIEAVYLSMRRGSGEARFVVGVEGEVVYRYPVTLRGKGVSRAMPGRGIRENYLAFGLETPQGQDFILDGIEIVLQPAKTRKVG